MDERLEGEYADVGGMPPYTMTFTANYIGNAAECSMLCIDGYEGSVDVKIMWAFEVME